ncbi:MAG TPA: carboxypeptidase-like regulatory domain-containing protein, partial [Puia sp.]|nr:carboxypeptidase-like regulatory domain-containing protein [Puia sp.]
MRQPDLVAFAVLLATLLLFARPLSAQPSGAHRISGKITSQTTGSPVIGATITVKGTKNAVQASDNGDFVIMAAAGERLIITNVGFLPREVVVTNAAEIDIALRQDYNNLNDVVVVGYGKMKKTDLSSSQVTVTSEELHRTVNSTIEQALQGKAANVYVASSNAQPGAAPSVVIRGISSLSQGTQPLYVIDGVQIKPSDPQGGAAGSYNAPMSYASPLAGLNPD